MRTYINTPKSHLSMAYFRPIAMKKALIICPSYYLAANATEREFNDFLVKARLLPRPLYKEDENFQRKGYNFAADLSRLVDAFSLYGFPHSDIHVINDEIIDVERLMYAVKELASHKDNDENCVSVLVFCGHGTAAELSAVHGSLVLSYNDRFTSVALDKCLEGFKGTFVTVLNMCSASGVCPPLNYEASSLSGKAAMDANKHDPISGACKRISLFSSPAFAISYGDENGSPFIQTFCDLLHRFHGKLCYQNFAEHWSEVSGGKTTIYYRNTSYTGAFLGPACIPPRLVSYQHDPDFIFTMYD